MRFKKIRKQTKLHDGGDENFYGEKTIKIDEIKSMSFDTTKIEELTKLEKNLDDYVFETLLQSFNGTITKSNSIPEFTRFKNQFDLTVYYKETEQYLAIISLGERQPMRYQIFLEGLFKKENNNA
ncbi:hypothetical protein LNJ05_12610 [Tenacibaculum finnmarkense genomovar ulcerans]|uniref:hypothetical protein n=1 Tax=Tenacibaculum finnmarkense TaxID=2781243 RepID=UPI001E631B8A|nr:hypothetical protein [Tenacibaculum finnmarkense]MCD8433605.1 hypothetical protein [Tenacibaculum finnmarkense genomovar ulcerans]